MVQYIFDGEIHALNENTAYIIEKNDKDLTPLETRDIYRKMYRKYAEYILESDRELAIEYIMRVFDNNISIGSEIENTNRIYRECRLSDCLSQVSTIAIKFKRSDKDSIKGIK